MTPRISGEIWKCFAEPQSFLQQLFLKHRPHSIVYTHSAIYLGFFSMDSPASRSKWQLIFTRQNVKAIEVLHPSMPSNLQSKDQNPVLSFSPRILGHPKDWFYTRWPAITSTHSHTGLVTHPSGLYPLLPHMAHSLGKWSFIIRVLIFKISLCIRWP